MDDYENTIPKMKYNIESAKQKFSVELWQSL